MLNRSNPRLRLYLIFGVLLLISAIIILAGVWKLDCNEWTNPGKCVKTKAFLFLFVLIPLLGLGACFVVLCEILDLRETKKSHSETEYLELQTSESATHEVITGDCDTAFLPSPAPYTGVKHEGTRHGKTLDSSLSDNDPPSYCSIFNHGSQLTGVENDTVAQENEIYSLTMPNASPEDGVPYPSCNLPKYEEAMSASKQYVTFAQKNSERSVTMPSMSPEDSVPNLYSPTSYEEAVSTSRQCAPFAQENTECSITMPNMSPEDTVPYPFYEPTTYEEAVSTSVKCASFKQEDAGWTLIKMTVSQGDTVALSLSI